MDDLGHLILVSVHAIAAGTALVAGVLTLLTGRGLAAHQVAVVAMTTALGASLTVGWTDIVPAARVAFLGLAGLAVVMVVQAVRAGRVRARETVRTGRPVGPRLVRVLGFNVIALAVGGTIVPVLRLEGGVVGVVLAVGLTVAAGHLLIERRVVSVSAPRAVSGARLERAQ